MKLTDKTRFLRRFRRDMARELGPGWRDALARAYTGRTGWEYVALVLGFPDGTEAAAVVCCRPERVPAEPFDPFAPFG